MDISSFLIWITFFGAIAAFALLAMSQAYVGSGSLAVVFPEPIRLNASATASEDANREATNPETASPEAANPAVANPEVEQFQQGNAAFAAGKYRQAADRFAVILQRNPQFAEAFHNRGRAIANLRSDNEAASTLVKAGELYLQQENTLGFEQVKQDLKLLKEKRIAEKALKEKKQPER